MDRSFYCKSQVDLIAGGHEECGNPVHAKNLVWWLPKNRYAVVQIARGRLCTFVDYNHEVTNRKHFTVADMLADHSLLDLVYHVLTSQDVSKFPFKWQDGVTFVSFNFDTWETKSKVQWRCHGHGQWRVRQQETDRVDDMEQLASAFCMRQ